MPRIQTCMLWSFFTALLCSAAGAQPAPDIAAIRSWYETGVKKNGILGSSLEIIRDGNVVLRVFQREGGMHISRAITFASDAVTSTGVAVGMLMSKVFHRLPNQDCRNGMDQEKGLVFCPAPDMSDVRLEFRCNYETHGDGLPPADVLARCPLEGIIWISEE